MAPSLTVSDDFMPQEMSSELTTFSRRAPRLEHSTAISVGIGIVGGVAMVAALFLALLLVLRKRRKRQKLQVALNAGKNIVQFPGGNNLAPVPNTFTSHSKEHPYTYQNLPPRSPSQPEPRRLDDAESTSPVPDTFTPQSKEHPYAYQNLPPRSPSQPEPRRLDNAESAWFMDDGSDELAQSPSTLSQQRVDAAQSPSVPANNLTIRPSSHQPDMENTPSGKPSRQNIIPGGDSAPTTIRPPSRKTSHQEFIFARVFPAENPSTRAPSRKTSRQKIGLDQNPSIPVVSSTTRTSAHSPPQAGRPESISKLGAPSLPPGPRATQQPERPPSPIVFRQLVQPESIAVVPRPRGSSLQGSRPNMIVTVPTPGRHVTSVSEDIARPVSRFSISPVSRSFPSRLTGSSPPSSNKFSSATRQHSRGGRFGSLSSLVHLRSDSAVPNVPNVPTDVTARPLQ
ncbi:hypothetical protein B0H14DRAFT_2434240 [Mycena olivaceomarginata]|nr:hypothetical protein B0H14DRAFT_2434240 [Mycena olivaceomarginata]